MVAGTAAGQDRLDDGHRPCRPGRPWIRLRMGRRPTRQRRRHWTVTPILRVREGSERVRVGAVLGDC